ATGPLDAGQQYLVVLSGLVSPASTGDGLAQHVFREDQPLALDANGRVRVVHAATGVGEIDIGRFTTDDVPAFVDIAEFAAIPRGGASAAAGTTILDEGNATPLNPGVRAHADPTGRTLRFGAGSLATTDRFFGVFAGAWSPTASQVPARFIVVKTAPTQWTTTVLSPLAAPVVSCPTNLIISQVYGGGGNGGSSVGVFRNDFIELHNPGATPVDLTGLAVQYASALGTAWNAQALPSAIVPPGGYFLIQEGSGGSVTQPPLPDPDYAPATSLQLNMSGTSGKVALTSTIAPLVGACPLAEAIDIVGYGTASCFEGSATPVLNNATAAIRNDGGCSDANVNTTDFTVATPVPRNGQTPANICACRVVASVPIEAVELAAFDAGARTAHEVAANVCMRAE
ncbi:MAG: lamin tail domain-containing protein, partial [Myxococcales bacterium]|nr:lamin tail domain-containing protein [Myxococcales bacterium]